MFKKGDSVNIKIFIFAFFVAYCPIFFCMNVYVAGNDTNETIDQKVADYMKAYCDLLNSFVTVTVGGGSLDTRILHFSKNLEEVLEDYFVFDTFATIHEVDGFEDKCKEIKKIKKQWATFRSDLSKLVEQVKKRYYTKAYFAFLQAFTYKMKNDHQELISENIPTLIGKELDAIRVKLDKYAKYLELRSGFYIKKELLKKQKKGKYADCFVVCLI